jgi:hypothetical protein
MQKFEHTCVHEGCWYASMACECQNKTKARSERFLVKGKCLTKHEALVRAAAGEAVHVVPELAGGGCGMSVSNTKYAYNHHRHGTHDHFLWLVVELRARIFVSVCTGAQGVARHDAWHCLSSVQAVPASTNVK